jgi:hypothetical protein
MPPLILEHFQERLGDLHRSLEEAVNDLAPGQLHWRPDNRGNHIAFNLWHVVRTEDNCTQFVLQRQPTLWMEAGWDQKLGLDAKAQGTGWTDEQAINLRLPSAEEFLVYARSVWGQTRRFLDTLDEEALSRRTVVRPLGEVPVAQIVGGTLITHSYCHLGEIWHLRTLIGLPGSPL